MSDSDHENPNCRGTRRISCLCLVHPCVFGRLLMCSLRQRCQLSLQQRQVSSIRAGACHVSQRQCQACLLRPVLKQEEQLNTWFKTHGSVLPLWIKQRSWRRWTRKEAARVRTLDTSLNLPLHLHRGLGECYQPMVKPCFVSVSCERSCVRKKFGSGAGACRMRVLLLLRQCPVHFPLSHFSISFVYCHFCPCFFLPFLKHFFTVGFFLFYNVFILCYFHFFPFSFLSFHHFVCVFIVFFNLFICVPFSCFSFFYPFHFSFFFIFTSILPSVRFFLCIFLTLFIFSFCTFCHFFFVFAVPCALRASCSQPPSQPPGWSDGHNT